VSAELEGATTMVAIELVDASGVVLGRVARAAAGDGASDCTETGHATQTCAVEAFVPSVTMAPVHASWIDFTGVDLRRVATVRRIFELARTGTGAASLVIEGVGIYTPPCEQGWWRDDPHLARFDLDQPADLPAGFTASDDPMRAFVVSECGEAL